jgi:hypothetical protein
VRPVSDESVRKDEIEWSFLGNDVQGIIDVLQILDSLRIDRARDFLAGPSYLVVIVSTFPAPTWRPA